MAISSSTDKLEPLLKKGTWIFGLYSRWVYRAEKDYYEKNIWGFVRLATEEEIEKHLVAEAKKRGFRMGAIITSVSGIPWVAHDDTLYYNKTMDCLFCNVKPGRYVRVVAIYDKGEWGTVSFPKKPSPKTRKEFNKFLADWCSRYTKNTDEFLSEYDIES